MTRRILQGDCVEVMKTIPSASIGFVLTDPPYAVRYRDRSGRTILNDDNDAWLAPAFAEMYRALRPNAFCVGFYGWDAADRFITAWRQADFRMVGHIVFRKPYASSTRFLERRHEQAYLLMKGNAAIPAAPLPDVMDWKYTGNRLHPTQKPVSILKPLVRGFSRPGEIVLDPFCGSGSTLVAARLLQRGYLGIELDPRHHQTACHRMRNL
jgi:DNA modification methylase